MLTKQATTAATLGCLVVLLICMFPPRDALQTREPKPRGFLLDDHIDRADVAFNPATKTGTFTRVEVGIGRMLAEICAACSATGLAVCLLILRQYSAAASGKHPIQELVEEREAS